jgi:WD40 repeat protein
MSTLANDNADLNAQKEVNDSWEGKYTVNDDENVIQNTKFVTSKIASISLKENPVKVVDGSKSKSSKKIVPYMDISDNPAEVFVTKFSPEGNLLAAGCGDGAIRVFQTNTGRLAYNLNVNNGSGLPTTAICFRPASGVSKTRNVLLSVNSDGSVQHWHVTSGRCLHEINDVNNPLLAVDYNPDGSKFATAGKDTCVRIYDEATKTEVCSMKGGMMSTQKPLDVSLGHSNRVFSVKFVPEDDNMLVSGGWDNTVQIWDSRVEMAVRSFYGPHICGNAVDVKDGMVLTGSWRQEHQLQLWDFGTGKLIEEIQWGPKSKQDCMLYCAKFSKSGNLIAAGGSGLNEAKIFDRSNKYATVGTVAGLSRGVYSLDFNHNGSKFCVAGGDTTIRLFNIENV